MSVTREKLYEEVWAEPMTTVAARYGVSSNFLSRVCVNLKVPHPRRGYWAKRAFGKAPNQPPLPPAQPGDELEWTRGGPRRGKRPLPRAPEPARRRTRPRSERPERHQLVTGVRAEFEKGRITESGQLRPLKRVLIDIVVSKGQLQRAIDLTNEFFLALEDRGHRVVLAPRDEYYHRPELHLKEGERPYDYYHRQPWAPSRETLVFIGTVAIGLTLYEINETVEFRYLNGEYRRASELPTPKRPYDPVHSWTTKRDTASGCLALRAYSPYGRTTWEQQWRERKAGDLQRQVKTIIRALEAAAPAIADRAAEALKQAEEETRRWKEEERRRKRTERRQRQLEAVKQSREQLLAIVQAWALARNVDAFFEDADRRAGALPSDAQAAVGERLDQARQLLGGTDPLKHFLEWKSPRDRCGQFFDVEEENGEEADTDT